MAVDGEDEGLADAADLAGVGGCADGVGEGQGGVGDFAGGGFRRWRSFLLRSINLRISAHNGHRLWRN